jgi:hypothetical protein
MNTWQRAHVIQPISDHADGTDISSATVLTPPTGATKVLMQAVTQNIRYTLDGTTPTATTGFQLVASDPPLLINIESEMTLTVIEETATADIQLQWGY